MSSSWAPWCHCSERREPLLEKILNFQVLTTVKIWLPFRAFEPMFQNLPHVKSAPRPRATRPYAQKPVICLALQRGYNENFLPTASRLA